MSTALIIRKEQMEVLKQYMHEQFINWAAAHLRLKFNGQTKALTDDDMRALVNSGIEKAKAYDIKVREDVLRLLEIMIIYGRDFDSDPENTQAVEILAHKT